MKKILTVLILSFFTITCHAEEITCFTEAGQVFYQHEAYDVKIIEGFYVFQEPRTGKLVYIDGECVVKFNKPILSAHKK